MTLKNNLSLQMMVALIVGSVLGIVMQSMGMGVIAKKIASPIGSLFMNMIQMVIIPLVFSTVIVGMWGLGDIKKFNRLGIKTLLYFIITTCIAASIGLLVGDIMQIGKGVGLNTAGAVFKAPPQADMLKTLINFIPSNVFKSFASGDMVQIIIFALALGGAMVTVGEKAKPIFNLFSSFSEIMIRLTMGIMRLAPIGIFAFAVNTFADFGKALILPVIGLLVAIYVGFILHNILIYGGSAKLMGNTSFSSFYSKSMPSLLFAFTSQTSSASLPFLTEAAKKMGVPLSIHGFLLPLGTAIHKDGTALYQSVAVIFLANLYGIELSIATMIMVVVAATLASIGTAGVPQGGMVTLGMVLLTAGVPIDGVALIAGLLPIIGMGSTVNNVAGDLSAAVVVAHSENLLHSEPQEITVTNNCQPENA